MNTTIQEPAYLQYIPEKGFDTERNQCAKLIERGFRFGGMTKDLEYARTIVRELSFYKGSVANVEILKVKIKITK